MPEGGKMASKAGTAAEPAENPEDAAEAPLLDPIALAIKEMLCRNKEHRNVTYDEINAAVDRVSSEVLDRALLAEAKTFASAADLLLRTADQVLAQTRQGRKETAELLDRLEARLASHG